MTKENLNQLRECFTEDFTQWLLKSNNPKVGCAISRNRYKGIFTNKIMRIEDESLSEILNIIMREPEANYFVYSNIEQGCGLYYSLPNHDLVAGDSLKVNKEKIKVLLRDIKIESILF